MNPTTSHSNPTNAYTVPSVSITTARTGASSKANALGMRAMQERAYAKRGEQYLLIKSPPASGKSRALMFIALDKLNNQGLRQAIIVVPERSIGSSFADEPLSQYGFYWDWRVTDPDMGPLFGDVSEPDDIETGTIYVLRSRSNHPFVAEHRELIHKIGVTGSEVETRIAGAGKDATYLLADVEVVAIYKLHNLDRTKLENIFHRLFGAARLDLTIEDRFGHPVKPREWFLVPLHVIDEAVQRIQDGSITGMHYDPETARLVG